MTFHLGAISSKGMIAQVPVEAQAVSRRLEAGRISTRFEAGVPQAAVSNAATWPVSTNLVAWMAVEMPVFHNEVRSVAEMSSVSVGKGATSAYIHCVKTGLLPRLKLTLESFWLVVSSQFEGILIEDTTASGMYGASQSLMVEVGTAEGLEVG